MLFSNEEDIVKKVGIITICDYKNYGNRLQNYATQEVINSLGFQAETIVNIPSDVNKLTSFKKKLTRVKDMPPNELYTKIKGKINYQFNQYLEKERINAFKKFTEMNINETEFTISLDNIPENLSDKYDFFIVGSDQVWNPIFRNCSPIDFLTFAPKQKRIAYAPSFGISSIPEEFAENYKKWISEFNYLSVREKEGANIIKQLTGRDAIVLVDPTLMLTKEKWLSISNPAIHKPKNSYLLTYFLGDIPREYHKLINATALKNKLEIVNLADKKDKKRNIADPSEFIDYINSANVLFTDSFHGAVFSILLQKPFIIFDRLGNIPSMNSRIDTLLSTFNLYSRKWDNIKNNDDIFDVDYSHVAQILEIERKRALDYLREAFEITDEKKHIG